MDMLDALMLARIQFAFTVSFHIIFPAFSIGLASYLAVLNGLWLWTGRSLFLDLFNYWKKIFAVAFGMGVVSGIVMSYQFGTNWSVFSDKAGPVLGPLMGYEVLSAFFLEAGFLGVMLFGLQPGRAAPAFPRHADGGARHLHVGVLDPVGQQLDADAGRLRHQRCRPVRGRRLVGGDLQPVLPLPARPHGAGRLPDHGPRRRRGRRPPSAARARQPARPHHVLDGDVDGGARRAGADGRRRLPRHQHAGAPAGQDRGDGGPFRDPGAGAR